MNGNETRDKLYDLLGECENKYSAYCDEFHKNCREAETETEFQQIYDSLIRKHDFFADYLIENGAIVPPCKIGDTVYCVCEDDEGNFIQENKVTEVCTKGFWVSCYVPPENDMGLFESYEDIGKTIFFIKEEAEQKLKEISYG